jgi:hypothetical protein
VEVWYISPRFGILCQEKSGNPDLTHKNLLSEEVDVGFVENS